jgi:hypothetical protein
MRLCIQLLRLCIQLLRLCIQPRAPFCRSLPLDGVASPLDGVARQMKLRP